MHQYSLFRLSVSFQILYTFSFAWTTLLPSRFSLPLTFLLRPMSVTSSHWHNIFDIFTLEFISLLRFLWAQTLLSGLRVLEGDLLVSPGVDPRVVDDHIVRSGVGLDHGHHPLLHLALQDLLELLSGEGVEQRVKDGGPIGHHQEAQAQTDSQVTGPRAEDDGVEHSYWSPAKQKGGDDEERHPEDSFLSFPSLPMTLHCSSQSNNNRHWGPHAQRCISTCPDSRAALWSVRGFCLCGSAQRDSVFTLLLLFRQVVLKTCSNANIKCLEDLVVRHQHYHGRKKEYRDLCEQVVVQTRLRVVLIRVSHCSLVHKVRTRADEEAHFHEGNQETEQG